MARFTTALLACVLLASGCARSARAVLTPFTVARDTLLLRAVAPDSFDVEMVTTKGTMLVRARRHWAPNGVDRFYAMSRSGYFDSVGFYRAIRGFVAQFGYTADTTITRAWNGKTFPDDPVRVTNQRGTLSFARPNRDHSRSTQLFFNWVDNPRLDTLNTRGFPPVAQIIQGLAVLDSINSEYSGAQGQPPVQGIPDQNLIAQQGGAYLTRMFPRMDYILSARVVRSWTTKR
jgi:peptidyl-prolyl cis-trans isomerase A (cyclophilin A)